MATPVLAPGATYERYVIDGVLGHGGYAIVYRAHEKGTADQVALKVLDTHHRRPADCAQLRREFDLAKRLDHPHIIGMYKAGDCWLTMQVIAGGTIMSLPDMADRMTALTQIADALDYAHQRGIVHCDVKPTNILVAKDFSRQGAVLIDFGVAHVVADGCGQLPPAHIEGSLPYAAPELLYGNAPTPATDEYALACTLVEVITGAPPFRANTSMELIDHQLKSPPPRISRKIDWVPHAVDSILLKAMAKSPEKRYGSCSEFVGYIRHALR
jgi:serine/threonine protein kinase